MAGIRKILVATDFSAEARSAQETALTMARALGASVTLLHVYHLPAYVFFDGATFLPPPSVVAQIVSDHTAALNAAKDAAASSGVPVETATEQGIPHDDIVRYAEEHEIDLIVMGTHGRRGWRRLVLGSVAERVVREAHVPVMTVPPAQHD
jgi:nucleotide-binding universal stress UspA family protein